MSRYANLQELHSDHGTTAHRLDAVLAEAKNPSKGCLAIGATLLAALDAERSDIPGAHPFPRDSFMGLSVVKDDRFPDEITIYESVDAYHAQSTERLEKARKEAAAAKEKEERESEARKAEEQARFDAAVEKATEKAVAAALAKAKAETDAAAAALSQKPAPAAPETTTAGPGAPAQTVASTTTPPVAKKQAASTTTPKPPTATA